MHRTIKWFGHIYDSLNKWKQNRDEAVLQFCVCLSRLVLSSCVLDKRHSRAEWLRFNLWWPSCKVTEFQLQHSSFTALDHFNYPASCCEIGRSWTGKYIRTHSWPAGHTNPGMSNAVLSFILPLVNVINSSPIYLKWEPSLFCFTDRFHLGAAPYHDWEQVKRMSRQSAKDHTTDQTKLSWSVNLIYRQSKLG